MPDVLLIYPFGRSDLQQVDEDGDRRTVKPVLELKLAVSRLVAKVGACDLHGRASEQAHLRLLDDAKSDLSWRMPILGDTLKHVGISDSDTHVTLLPIVSRQPATVDSDLRENDTHHLLELLQRIADRWPSQYGKLTVRDAWEVTAPADHGSVAVQYEAFYALYCDFAGHFSARFLQTTPGTPAMSYAAVTFARDPRIVFLYTPYRKPTKHEQIYRDAQQSRTRSLAKVLLDAYEFRALADAVEQPDNGFTPLLEDIGMKHSLADAVTLARALDAWRHGDFMRAVDWLEGIDGDGIAGFRAVCSALADPAISEAERVRARMRDAVLRLALARLTHDLFGGLLSLLNMFVEGARRHFGRLISNGARLTPRNADYWERLVARGTNDAAAFLALDWYVNHETRADGRPPSLREVRNRRIHEDPRLLETELAECAKAAGLTTSLAPLDQWVAAAVSVVEAMGLKQVDAILSGVLTSLSTALGVDPPPKCVDPRSADAMSFVADLSRLRTEHLARRTGELAREGEEAVRHAVDRVAATTRPAILTDDERSALAEGLAKQFENARWDFEAQLEAARCTDEFRPPARRILEAFKEAAGLLSKAGMRQWFLRQPVTNRRAQDQLMLWLGEQ